MNNSVNRRHPSQSGGKAEDIVQRTVDVLGRDFVLIGTNRVTAWHAGLLIGLAAGVAMGIILVANQGGEFEPPSAQTISPAVSYAKLPVPSSALVNGTNTVYRFSVTAGTEAANLKFIKFLLSQSGVSVDPTSLFLWLFTDSAFSVSGGGFAAMNSNSLVTGSSPAEVIFEGFDIPAGTTRYF